jgi:hypothetical protein
LGPAATNTRICSYECTFCADCVDNVLHNVCPNCGGGFVPRPVRPVGEYRPGDSLAISPASTRRRHLRFTLDEVAAFSATLCNTLPENR